MNTRYKMAQKLLLAIGLCIGACFAVYSGGFHGGGYHGGYHGGDNDDYHGVYNNGYRPNVHDDDWNGSGVILNVPNGGYDDSSCETTNVCNSYGQCWTEQNCD